MVAAGSVQIVRFPENLRVRSFLHSEADVGLHLHAAFEFVVVLRGRVYLQTDREARVLSRGDVGIVHCWQPHGTQRLAERNRMLVVQIDSALASADADFPRRRFTLPENTDPSVEAELCAMAARLHIDTMQRREGWALQAESQALRMLSFLAQNAQCTLTERPDGFMPSIESAAIGTTLRRAMDYISDHYNHQISLGDVAAANRTTANYLARLFRSEGKTSFLRFLTQLRLMRAADRLKNEPRTTVLSIALDVGFPNIAAFNTAFRRSFGATPTSWRKFVVSPMPAGIYPAQTDHEDIELLSELVGPVQARVVGMATK